MADRNLDEYEALKFYADNTKAKKSGFSKFQVEDRYYFCRYVDGDIAMISQAYTGKPGRDNGIDSVRKNEKIASRYKFDTRGKSGHGFGLRAGNGQEIAISPNYASLRKAQSVASRMSGASFTGGRKAAAKRKSINKKPAKTAQFTAKDGRIENYKPLSFYRQNGTLKAGFNSFEKDGAYYFHYVENGEIVLISESYTSRSGRDNGISSVIKNRELKSAYQYHKHKNGKHYFDLNAANGQEIATSRWYSSNAKAREGAAYIRGDKKRRKATAKSKTRVAAAPKTRSKSAEDNYPPLAFYRKHTKGKAKGFEKFQGDDGEYYFTYFENSKLALISEGYPTAVIRDKGLASVQKNMKIEKRYVQGTGADGKPGFILRAGNHKEIARSVGYGSAAAAVTGAAYLLGKRRRPATKPKVTKPRVKKTVVKKAAAPVKPVAKPKPKPKPRPKVKTLAGGTVAVAGLAAGAAASKANAVKKAAIPVKAAPIKAAPVKAAPPPPPPAPVVTPAPVTAPVPAPVTAPVAAAAVAPVEGAGIWGWLKWLLLALLVLLAALFLFKSCVGGSDKVATPIATSSPTPAALITCWNGSKAKNDAACPAKVTCWDESFATSLSACPVRPVERNFDCWDGSKAVDLAGCPVKPALKVAVVPAAPKPSRPKTADRFCGPSSNPLFNASGVTPKTVTRLGTNVQFGNSLSLSPNAFYARLQNRYNSSATDKAFLDLLARSLGYGSFQNMDASMFTNDTLPNGTSGILGLGQQHAVQFSTLNVTDPTHLEAFKVRSANGTDVHFMKRCGNFMYVCQR